jgi:dTDP-4-amino-4,6-dideoxygalactose transaminase
VTVVPFHGAEREWAAHGTELRVPLEAALASGRWLQGPEVAAFEQALAEMTGRAHAVAVGSGTDALFFALRALGIGAGDEVLVPDVSFLATGSAVVRAGAVPVWCDVDADGLLDLGDAARRAGPRTAAVVAVPLYGRALDAGAVEAFAARHGLALVEDAAQALGARGGGRPSGGVGAASCLSFDPTKPLAAPGSGGAVLTDDDAVAAAVRRLRWHGRDAAGEHAELGFNSQLPTAAAALLHAKLAHEPAWRARRGALAARYAAGLRDVEGLRVPPPAPAGHEHAWSKVVLRVPGRRDVVRERLAADGVPAPVHYARPLHDHPVFAAHAPAGGGPPGARALTEEVLSLPVHPFLADAEVDRVVAAVRAALLG